jgi:hypothetical protein
VPSDCPPSLHWCLHGDLVPLGAGFAPAGFAPAGFGSPDVAAANIPIPLPDPLTALSLTGRNLNFNAGTQQADYIFSADGRIAGMATMQQLVLLALFNGNIFTGLDRKLANYQRTIAGRVTTALSPYIKKGWLQLLSVDVVFPTGAPDATAATVTWRDLTLAAPGTQPGTTQNIFTSPIPTT